MSKQHTVSMNDFQGENGVIRKEIMSGPSNIDGKYKRMAVHIDVQFNDVNYVITVDKTDTKVTAIVFEDAIDKYNEL